MRSPTPTANDTRSVRLSVKKTVHQDLIQLRRWNRSVSLHPERKVKIGSKLDPVMREALIQFMKKKQEVFAWSYADMPVP